MHALEPELIIDDAGGADLAALGNIWLELMLYHQGEDPHFNLADDALPRWLAMAREVLERDDTFLHKAVLGGRPVGMCVGWIAQNPPIYRTAEVGFISELAVARSARRRGVGSLLLAEAKRWFARNGIAELQLSTAVWNRTARAFWEANGGEQLLVRYRFDTGVSGSSHGS